MKRRTFLLAALFLVILPATWSQQLGKRITNKDIIDIGPSPIPVSFGAVVNQASSCLANSAKSFSRTSRIVS